MFTFPRQLIQLLILFATSENSHHTLTMRSERWMEHISIAAHRLLIGKLHAIGKAVSHKIALHVSHFPCNFYISSVVGRDQLQGIMYSRSCLVDLRIPQGKFYLADAGFGVCDSLLVPYRGVRYHLAEWGCANSRYIAIPIYISLFIYSFIDPQTRRNFLIYAMLQPEMLLNVYLVF